MITANELLTLDYILNEIKRNEEHKYSTNPQKEPAFRLKLIKSIDEFKDLLQQQIFYDYSNMLKGGLK